MFEWLKRYTRKRRQAKLLRRGYSPSHISQLMRLTDQDLAHLTPTIGGTIVSREGKKITGFELDRIVLVPHIKRLKDNV